MKVEGGSNVHVLDTLVKTGSGQPQKGSEANGKNSQPVVDKVEISATREEVARLTEKAMASTDNRAEKIEAVKEAVQAGTYQVYGQKVAKAMLKDHLLNEVL